MTTDLPEMQMNLRPGFVELGWGHPALELLPLAELRRVAAEALVPEHNGALALVYGAAQGPGRLIELIRERLSRIDGRETPAGRLLITGGISQALDLVCGLCTHPGDVALVESPVYHFALHILRDHGLELVPVAADAAGLRLDALEDALARLRKAGRQARLLYTVPTFNNPTGGNLAPARREGLVRIAGEHDLLVLEDDVYRELWFDELPPPALASYDVPARVIRLGSFSKIAAPGLRLGWLAAEESFVQRAMSCGLLTSGGGINHFTAHLLAEYIRLGLLDAHVADLRAAYRVRRDALMAALRRHLPVGCHFEPPGGGFFLWLRLPEGIDSVALLSPATATRVGYVPGTQFHTDGGGGQHLRLAFSLLSPGELDEGARRLGEALRAVE